MGSQGHDWATELFLYCVKACKSVCVLVFSCVHLCDHMDCSLPGSSVHGISPDENTGMGCHFLLQGCSWPRDQTHISCISCIGRQILYHKLGSSSLFRSHLLIYLLFLLPWETDLRKQYNSCQNILPTLSSRSFMVSCLMLKIFILNLVLCMVWRCVLNSFIYMCLFNFPSTTCWRDFFSFYTLYLLVEY